MVELTLKTPNLDITTREKRDYGEEDEAEEFAWALAMLLGKWSRHGEFVIATAICLLSEWDEITQDEEDVLENALIDAASNLLEDRAKKRKEFLAKYGGEINQCQTREGIT